MHRLLRKQVLITRLPHVSDSQTHPGFHPEISERGCPLVTVSETWPVCSLELDALANNKTAYCWHGAVHVQLRTVRLNYQKGCPWNLHGNSAVMKSGPARLASSAPLLFSSFVARTIVSSGIIYIYVALYKNT